MMEELDFSFGSVMSLIESHGVANSTLFIWTSDNGPKGIYSKLMEFGHDVLQGLRDNKRSIFEGGHRVLMYMI